MLLSSVMGSGTHKCLMSGCITRPTQSLMPVFLYLSRRKSPLTLSVGNAISGTF
jgi:hypothetical protein